MLYQESVVIRCVPVDDFRMMKRRVITRKMGRMKMKITLMITDLFPLLLSLH